MGLPLSRVGPSLFSPMRSGTLVRLGMSPTGQQRDHLIEDHKKALATLAESQKAQLAAVEAEQKKRLEVLAREHAKEIAAHNEKHRSGKIHIVAELAGGGVKDQGYKAAEDLLQAHRADGG